LEVSLPHVSCRQPWASARFLVTHPNLPEYRREWGEVTSVVNQNNNVVNLDKKVVNPNNEVVNNDNNSS
jgi:hypothetical protein